MFTHWQRGNSKFINKTYTVKGISPGRGKSKEKSLGIHSASEPTLYYTSPWPGPSPGIPHWSWPPLTLDIAYYSNDMTLNIRCHGGRPIFTTTPRVSGEHQSRVWIGGCVGAHMLICILSCTWSLKICIKQLPHQNASLGRHKKLIDYKLHVLFCSL